MFLIDTQALAETIMKLQKRIETLEAKVKALEAGKEQPK